MQALFLPASNESEKFLFENHQLGALAFLCAVFSNRICLDVVLPAGKIILVF